MSQVNFSKNAVSLSSEEGHKIVKVDIVKAGQTFHFFFLKGICSFHNSLDEHILISILLSR